MVAMVTGQRFLPLLLLLACSTPTPRAFRQAAPVAPEAPPFDPTTDAPTTTGQPGYVGDPERLPRSPYTRVLPPTREPGLWAADPPRASLPEGNGQILGVEPPFTEPAELAVAKACAVDAYVAAEALQLRQRLESMRPEARACAAARAWWLCAEDADEAARARGSPGAPPEGVDSPGALHARDQMLKACRGLQLDRNEARWIDALLVKMARMAKTDRRLH
jgi:hypothetical protein